MFLAPNAAIVLDGASQPIRGEHDGGWLADTLGARLRDRLVEWPGADLETILAQTIEETTRRYALVPGLAPSTTVNMVRWTAEEVDVLVLGDSPVVALTRDDRIVEVRDDRLSRVAAEERQALRDSAGRLGFDSAQGWNALIDAQRQQRNRPTGYWIAEAVPEAAAHAVRARWDINDLVLVVAMTDGVANGVDHYGVPEDWRNAVSLARDDPSRLVDLVHLAEQSDADGARWPRSKRHDDKAIVVVEFSRFSARSAGG